MALPSQRCETIEFVDQEALSRQLGLPKLVDLLESVPLKIVPNGVPADIRVDFSFAFGSGGRIQAAIRGWAEKEAVSVESESVRWVEDFQAGRRTVEPLAEADAQAFRQQVVQELTKYVEARQAAVVIASEPEGLPVVTTVADSKIAPLNRNRTVAVLGCLRDGAELEGHVTWPDGRREPFKRQANLSPGRFVVGSKAPTEPPAVPESPPLTEPSAVDPEPAVPPEKPASSGSVYWWLGGALVIFVLGFLARTRIKKR